MLFNYLPSNGISETSMGSGSGEGIRCDTDDADTDFLDGRVCFGFTEKKYTGLSFKLQSYTVQSHYAWKLQNFTAKVFSQKFRQINFTINCFEKKKKKKKFGVVVHTVTILQIYHSYRCSEENSVNSTFL